jgi:hypothetical protein
MPISEASFQSLVIETAQWNGWKVLHVLPARNQRGKWLSSQAGDFGFPDLVLAHRDRGVIFAELKTMIGKITENQQDWITTLKSGGAEVYVWRPSDWNEIKAILTERKP